MNNFLHVLNRWFRVWAVRPAGLIALGVLSAALPYSILLRDGPPVPAIHDEFAYLLNAETFAHGRLANPPVPPELKSHLETFMELVTPTFVGKYPPGSSLPLTIGVWLGHPFFGIILTFALLGPAFAWALRPVLPATWAWVASLMAMSSLVNSYWANSYWGGTLFALEGALIFGGALRLARRPDWHTAFWCGLGAALAALTRPHEGFWFSLVPLGVVLRAMWRTRTAPILVFKMAMAGLLPVAVALVFLGMVNHAATGSALVFPHRLYGEQYVPDDREFNWEQPAPPPPDRPAFIANFIAKTYYGSDYLRNPTAGAILGRAETNAVNDFHWFLAGGFDPHFVSLDPEHPTSSIWDVLLAPFCVAALLSVLSLGRGHRGLALTMLVMASWLGPGLLVRFFEFPHYSAAWFAPLVLLAALGLRWVWAWRRKLSGTWRMRFSPVWLGALVLVWAVAQEGVYLKNSFYRAHWSLQRELMSLQLADQAAATGRKALIFVLYPKDYARTHAEWVFNDADWATAPVIWARALNPGDDAKFAAHFPDRQAYLLTLTPDSEPAAFQPFSVTGISSPAAASPVPVAH